MPKQPSAEQLAALTSYARHEGPEWKRKLLIDWQRSGTDKSHARPTYALLQQVRNRFGPAWLARFEVPTLVDEDT
jgi:hypothetical protein